MRKMDCCGLSHTVRLKIISLDKTTSILYPIKIQESNLILLHRMPGPGLGIFFLSHWWTIWNKPISMVDKHAVFKGAVTYDMRLPRHILLKK